MSSRIPTSTTVLIIGGGPGGSYAASILAREGIDTVLLEADVFPRYHVGESMLPSLRHFLKFIDADEKFDTHGFKRKVGAAFLFNIRKRPGYADFIAEGGAECYTWNIDRAEADEMLLRHASEQGAQVIEGTKVISLTFSGDDPASSRPVSADWRRKDGSSGTISFDYLIDASGRSGLLSTKYLHNRVFNQSLRNIATWGYWSDCGVYEEGTARADVPYFEALQDESGWAWFIPLHGNRTSVGVVMDQEVMASKKRAERNGRVALSTEEFYKEQLASVAPNVTKLIEDGKLISGSIRSASDFSYSAPSYAGPQYRVVGDAGAFIDPFFSSGVHLALTSGLSAAATICASIRGHCDEAEAGRWHTEKFAAAYTRFLIVVLSAYVQIRNQDKPVLTDVDVDNFDKAFDFFKPVIQGIADVKAEIPRIVISKTIEFCADAFDTERDTKEPAASESESGNMPLNTSLSPMEQGILKGIVGRKMMRAEDTMHVGAFATDVINGLRIEMKRFSLGLTRVE